MPLAYDHAPRPIAGPVSFRLDGDRLTVDSGRKVREVRLGFVDQVRMTCEARGLARRAFKTRLRLADGRSLAFSSVSWKSFVEAERLDAEYRAFALALLRAVAAANPQARFVAGRPRWAWALALAVGVAALGAIGLFVWGAMSAGHGGAALLGALFLAAGGWQLDGLVRLNYPRRFQPENPPQDLLP